MDTYYQREQEIINPQTEMHYAVLSSFHETQFPHSHDFFEFSLLLEGTQTLDVNGRHLHLLPGALILIRPNDIHSRAYLTSGRHINIAISSKVVLSMLDYLGESTPIGTLFSDSLPPYTTLSKQETLRVQSQLNELYAVHVQDEWLQRTKLRVLTMDLFAHHFLPILGSAHTSGDWFDDLLSEMERPEHLVLGLESLTVLSHRSHEHLCRIFRKRLDCTPTQYINDLRLNYVANFLRYSDLNILDISLNAGFDNISHFYHIFKKKYGVSPKKFRDTYKLFSHENI